MGTTIEPAFARKLQDIKAHPDRHRHTFEALQKCCIIEGSVSLDLVAAHSSYAPIGNNGGTRCDSTDGPCACGAWH